MQSLFGEIILKIDIHTHIIPEKIPNFSKNFPESFRSIPEASGRPTRCLSRSLGRGGGVLSKAHTDAQSAGKSSPDIFWKNIKSGNFQVFGNFRNLVVQNHKAFFELEFISVLLRYQNQK